MTLLNRQLITNEFQRRMVEGWNIVLDNVRHQKNSVPKTPSIEKALTYVSDLLKKYVNGEENVPALDVFDVFISEYRGIHTPVESNDVNNETIIDFISININLKNSGSDYECCGLGKYLVLEKEFGFVDDCPGVMFRYYKKCLIAEAKIALYDDKWAGEAFDGIMCEYFMPVAG